MISNIHNFISSRFFQGADNRVVKTLTYEENYALLRHFAHKKGMVIVDLPPEGTGNCFFTAVARQLSLQNVRCLVSNIRLNGPYIREKLIEYLEAQKNEWGLNSIKFLSEPLEYTISKIRNNAWANDFEIAATAKMFNITIDIIKSEGNTLSMYSEGQENDPHNNDGYLPMVNRDTGEQIKITIGHVGEEHYVALDSIHLNQSITQSRKRPTKVDDNLATHVEKRSKINETMSNTQGTSTIRVKTYAEAAREKGLENKSKSKEPSRFANVNEDTNLKSHQNRRDIFDS